MDKALIFVDTITAGLKRHWPQLDTNDAAKIAVEIYGNLAKLSLVEPILPEPPAPIPFKR